MQHDHKLIQPTSPRFGAKSDFLSIELMGRQKLITVGAMILALVGTSIAAGRGLDKPTSGTLTGTRPNIIFVLTDDQGYGPVGKHGHPWIKTPNLDTLHGQSTRFERFLVSPTCSPTRAALMSGRHPMKNGITHTILERERMALSTVTLPQVLSKAGYVSGIFGKWHLGDEEPYQPHKRGFHPRGGRHWSGLQMLLRRCAR
jgi:hypothetical protein